MTKMRLSFDLLDRLKAGPKTAKQLSLESGRCHQSVAKTLVSLGELGKVQKNAWTWPAMWSLTDAGARVLEDLGEKP